MSWYRGWKTTKKESAFPTVLYYLLRYIMGTLHIGKVASLDWLGDAFNSISWSAHIFRSEFIFAKRLNWSL